MKVIGIDPGVTGAIAVIDTTADTATVFDIPVAAVSSMNQVDPKNLITMVDGMVSDDPGKCIVFVEQVNANALSYKSNFVLGHALGCIVTVIAGFDIPMRRLKPKEWQAVTGLSNVTKAERKDAHRMRAMEMYPELRNRLGRKKDHNRADAVLIAEAGRRLHHAG